MSEPSEYRLAFERLGEILCSLERAPTATDIRRLRAVIDSYGAAAGAQGDQAGYERARAEFASDAQKLVRETCQAAIANARREAIEECAKIVEAAGLMRSAKAIRALAEPAPQQASQPQEQSA